MAGGKWAEGLTADTPLAAQERLIEAANGQPFSLDRLLGDTLAAVHKPHDESAGHDLIDLARPALGGLLKELDAAAGRDLSDYAQLHQVRIAGKRLRYA